VIDASFSQGIFPDALKVAKVVPIFKSDDKLLSNYRPVSVLSVISKIFERLMYKRLNTYFTNSNLIVSMGSKKNILLVGLWQFYGLWTRLQLNLIKVI